MAGHLNIPCVNVSYCRIKSNYCDGSEKLSVTCLNVLLVV